MKHFVIFCILGLLAFSFQNCGSEFQQAISSSSANDLSQNAEDNSSSEPEESVKFEKLDVSGSVYCGRSRDKNYHCWGMDLNQAPQLVGNLSNVVDSEIYGSIAVAVDSNLKLHCIEVHQFLSNSFEEIEATPCQPEGLPEVLRVSKSNQVGSNAICVLTSDQQVHCGLDLENLARVNGLPTDEQVTQLTADASWGCATVMSGDLFCWMMSEPAITFNIPRAKSIGFDENYEVLQAVQVALKGPAVDVSVGWYAACAVIDGGDAECWGLGHYIGIFDELLESDDRLAPYENQYGNTFLYTVAPVAVPGTGGITELSTTFGHFCGIAGNGGALCWGALPTRTSSVTFDIFSRPLNNGGIDSYMPVYQVRAPFENLISFGVGWYSASGIDTDGVLQRVVVDMGQ